MPKSILIAEDDMIISMVLERKVRKMNHNVAKTVTTGDEAIKAVEKLAPELILMDVQLGDEIDGIEAMNRIRKTSKVPVIYISGNTDIRNLKRAKQTRYIEYMVKP
ncbi:MAG: response regulator, partial [Balneolaceae bacterium]|nr:response regulator [Balneolaceae bacterium]